MTGFTLLSDFKNVLVKKARNHNLKTSDKFYNTQILLENNLHHLN
jgi:hypothetical protein